MYHKQILLDTNEKAFRDDLAQKNVSGRIESTKKKDKQLNTIEQGLF